MIFAFECPPSAAAHHVPDIGARQRPLEIHKAELVQRVNAHIQTGHFHDADEVLEKALDALEGTAPAPSSGHAAKSCDTRTGADLIAALQASPYRELDISNRLAFVYLCPQVTLHSDGMASRQ